MQNVSVRGPSSAVRSTDLNVLQQLLSICYDKLSKLLLHVASNEHLRSTYDRSFHAAAQFSVSTFTVSAESVSGSTPGVRVTWSTTVPPECVASVRVEFRTNSRGSVVANYTTTNTSQTEFIQTSLQCATDYYIRVVVTGETSHGQHFRLSSRQVEALVAGKEIVCMRFR